MRRSIVIVLCCALGAVTQAGVIYSTGFEAPTYAVGLLDNQNGWDGHTYATASAATIQTAIVHGGAQAVKIDSTPIPSSAWYVKDLTFDPVTTGNPIVTVESWMRLDPGSSNSTAWGLDVYGSTGARVGYMQVTSANAVIFNGVTTSTTITRGVWYDYKLVFDYTAHTYQGFVNGTPVAVAAAMPSFTGFGDADLACWGAGYDSAYFDDYSIVSSPEPASASLLALGALALLRRR